MSKHHYSYLALGDSYTIGESVPLHESFPYQAVQLMRKKGYAFQAPEIIAKTGWTSFELAEQLLHTQLNDAYDFVSLLIGVNNQYRGLEMDDFKTDFSFLLKKAIHLCGQNPAHVFVLSIPDWGCTPFARGKDAKTISKEIDAFNQICVEETRMQQASFIAITEESRKAVNDKTLLAKDGLHYSAKAHAVWAEKLAGMMQGILHG
jgi:lysophospholipase L1-like esterase